MVEKPSKMLSFVTLELIYPVPNEAVSNVTRSHGNVDPSSGVEVAGLGALRSHIPELQAESEDSLVRHAGIHKTQIEMLLKLCAETKKRGALEADVKRVTQQMADDRKAQGKGFMEMRL